MPAVRFDPDAGGLAVTSSNDRRASPCDAGECIFDGCGNLVEAVIPDGVTEIASGAFAKCGCLKKVTIPDSVTRIGDAAFENCTSLESLTLPAGVREIGTAAFDGCSGLRSVSIPEGVERISELLFFGCRSLESITIPGTVTAIAEESFFGCESLRTVYIPASVGKIAPMCFECTAMESIDVDPGNPVYHSADGVLMETGRRRLQEYPCRRKAKEYSIPSGTEEIREFAVSSDFLEKVTVPDTVKRIWRGAFSGCGSLKSVNIPRSVTEIGPMPFELCKSLRTIDVDPENPAYVSMGGALVDRESGTLIAYPLGRKDPKFTVPSSVEVVGACAFKGARNLKTLVLPLSVKEIGSHAFSGCDSLRTVTVQGPLEEVSHDAFSGCESLETVFVSPDADDNTRALMRHAVDFDVKIKEKEDRF